MIIDRSFKTPPPACLSKVKSFEFSCVRLPDRPDYCQQQWGELLQQSSQQIVDQLLCAQRAATWVLEEAKARGE